MKNKFDFTTPVDRRGSGSYKWDSDADVEYPLWVADMDFKTAPAIIEALHRRVDHGVFGYTHVPEDYYDATQRWFSTRYGLDIARDEIIYTTGVVPALSAIIKAFTRPGDGVLVMTPVYNCFFSSIRNNGCICTPSRLKIDDQGRYVIDWEDLEAKAADPKVRLLLLCNPHNPVGRVWTADELRRVAEIMARHSVKVVSDDIHCDLVFEPNKYVPFTTVNPDYALPAVTCASPSKTFNIAGLQIANIFAPSAEDRRMIERAINDNEICDVNPFGVTALITAYNRCADWLDELKEVIQTNYRHACAMFDSVPGSGRYFELQGTYLMWVDMRHLAEAAGNESLEEYIKERSKVWVNDGAMYGPGGEGFIRINLACPPAVFARGLDAFFTALAPLISASL